MPISHAWQDYEVLSAVVLSFKLGGRVRWPWDGGSVIAKAPPNSLPQGSGVRLATDSELRGRRDARPSLSNKGTVCVSPPIRSSVGGGTHAPPSPTRERCASRHRFGAPWAAGRTPLPLQQGNGVRLATDSELRGRRDARPSLSNKGTVCVSPPIRSSVGGGTHAPPSPTRERCASRHRFGASWAAGRTPLPLPPPPALCRWSEWSTSYYGTLPTPHQRQRLLQHKAAASVPPQVDGNSTLPVGQLLKISNSQFPNKSQNQKPINKPKDRFYRKH